MSTSIVIDNRYLTEFTDEEIVSLVKTPGKFFTELTEKLNSYKKQQYDLQERSKVISNLVSGTYQLDRLKNLEKPIQELNLFSTEISNLFNGYKRGTLSRIIELSEDDISKFNNIGPGKLRKIKESLNTLGLKLNMSHTDIDKYLRSEDF